MLEVESVCVDISRVGRVLDDVTMSAEPGVTVVTGRSGCGSTTLLRLIAGFHDRQVVRRQGVIRLSGRRIDAMSHAELRPQVAVVGHRPTGPLGCNDVECDSAIEQLGLQEWRGRPVARMSACEAARMALAEGIGSGAPVLLLDQLLAPMTSKWRSRAAACVAQMARAGRIVVWAEHALDYALGAADSVVEIIDGHARQVTASLWSSTNLPPTPLQEIAARSGEGVFTSPEQAHARLAATALTAVPSPQLQQPKGPVLARVDPAALRLSGGLIDVRAGQVLGIVAHEPVQAHRAARRLAATVRPRGVNDHLLHALLRQTSVQRACDMVDRRADRPIGESMELANEVLGPVGARRGVEHSEGQQRLLADVLACAGGKVVLWVDPGWAVDAASGDHLVQVVRRRGASVIMASRDVDLVARWCDRVLVVDEHEVVADGRPGSVVADLPYPPQVAQMFPGGHVVRAADVALIPRSKAEGSRGHA
ncbi:ATP-binding cassette domain-containing protein [Cutibacterium namnetense]|uniref:ABC transporter ATP-binding protein n=1 Tax=Cutibacterium namnetense TaxID=1574624 RepID=A0ABX9IBN1_9ACTN|nr:ATP-binding cassette domain-containing protein [Cutibacterium namnetense]REB70860.1 ABC transporter ATP-binding protein [Cutibacterium namnetense]